MARAMIEINKVTLNEEEKDTQYKNICRVYELFE
jgi:N-glycosylase/DNA lyase